MTFTKAVLIDHFEARLGGLEGAWSAGEGTPEGAPQVGWFAGGVLAGVHSFATIGLHRTPLASRTGRHLHLELLGCNRPVPGDEAGPFPGVLEYVSGLLISRGRAVLRGDVLRLPMPLTPGGSMTALYAALPVCFDEEFASVVLENGSDVAVVWLVPIGDREAEFVEREGWEAFENELVRHDPDLLDLDRPEMPQAGPHE
ncbi:suppressor of fused domain protein [Streptomyces zaomyceticus]|uniref:suppressor of fused domain protein n=1 Tax=Streptomyces zaomyceticus TaxID=68286 RepID=UPI00371A1FAD